MTKKPGSHHVVPNVDGGWDVNKRQRVVPCSGRFH